MASLGRYLSGGAIALGAVVLLGCNDVGMRAFYMSPDQQGRRNWDSFPKDTPDIFAIAEISTSISKMDLTARIKAKSVDGVPGGTVMWETQGTATQGESNVSLQLEHLPTGWPLGKFDSEILYEGDVLDDASFEIVAP